MLKFKIFLVLIVAFVYYAVTYCMLSPGICRYYVDYYILYERSFSIDEEREFLNKPIKEKASYFKEYTLKDEGEAFKMIGVSPEGVQGLWSNGNTVIMSFVLQQVYTNIELDFDMSAYINAKNNQVDVEVYHNDRQLADWHFIYERKQPKTKIKIAKKYLRENEPINLVFKINGAASPKKLGYSNEIKKFGLIFNKLKIMPYGE